MCVCVCVCVYMNTFPEPFLLLKETRICALEEDLEESGPRNHFNYFFFCAQCLKWLVGLGTVHGCVYIGMFMLYGHLDDMFFQPIPCAFGVDDRFYDIGKGTPWERACENIFKACMLTIL